MEQKYKVLFNIFNKFLLVNKCLSAVVELGDAFDIWSGNKFYCKREKESIQIPFPIPIVREISEYVEGVVTDEDNYYSESGEEYYNFTFSIIPEKRIVEVYGVYIEYGIGDESESVIDANEEPEVFYPIFDYLDEKNADILEVDVDAGGDSGWIHDRAYDVNGAEIEVSEEMKDVGYKLLNDFPGWEINEGSTVKFTWDRHRRILIFNFAYNTEESKTELISKENF